MSASFSGVVTHRVEAKVGYVRLEFGYSTVTEIAGLYRELAVACVQRDITRALIVAGDDEPAGERALRDAATMMVLAGVTEGLRLALVATSPRVAHTYSNAERDLNAAGIKTRLFEAEEDALHWLDAAQRDARHAA
jgi:hypothetical protein